MIATGTASGKSLAYQLPALDAIHRSELRALSSPASSTTTAPWPSTSPPPRRWPPTSSPPSSSLKLPTVRAETYDGDTDPASRRWIRDHANFVLANPDMLHFGILPNHAWWARFFRRLRYVIVDEAHSYRGVFGSHVANLMRRLRRICAYYAGPPSRPCSSPPPPPRPSPGPPSAG